jgi:putative ABC transport system substrate-binding protein
MPVIGFLDSGSFAANTRKVDAFRRGLAEAGYVENSNVVIEFRWADAQFWQLRPMADNLVRRQVAVIVAAAAVRLWRRRPPRRPSHCHRDRS